jgi:hypothetical protein
LIENRERGINFMNIIIDKFFAKLQFL